MKLRTVTRDPFNAEAPLRALGATVTPTDCFFVRNNFQPPPIDATTWRLRVHGAVHNEIVLDLAALQELPRVRRRVTLECAGNGRLLLDPPTEGTQWGLGAAGTADFEGTELRNLLNRAGIRDDACECVFSGADSGIVEDGSTRRFQRSLPVAAAEATLLCWSMNGEPLTRDHGHPVRLLVPGFYAVASVKWLVDIELATEPFDGYFQTDRYVYRVPDKAPVPVTLMHVRSLITSHADMQAAEAGEHVFAGTAWSGAGAITSVQLAVDGTDNWLHAELQGAGSAGEATLWRRSLRLDRGDHLVRVRATDSTGAVQPLEPSWNQLGYGNNAVQVIRLSVR